MIRYVIMTLVVACCSLPIKASQVKPYQVRAPLLLHMIEFTDYPRNRLNFDELSLCFLEPPNFEHAEQLSIVGEKTVKSMPFNIVRMVQLHEISSANCHMLFISAPLESIQLFKDMDVLNQTALTIGETRNFVEHGGLLSIVPGEQNMEIVINLRQLKLSPLKISSSVLKLAKLVE